MVSVGGQSTEARNRNRPDREAHCSGRLSLAVRSGSQLPELLRHLSFEKGSKRKNLITTYRSYDRYHHLGEPTLVTACSGFTIVSRHIGLRSERLVLIRFSALIRSQKLRSVLAAKAVSHAEPRKFAIPRLPRFAPSLGMTAAPPRRFARNDSVTFQSWSSSRATSSRRRSIAATTSRCSRCCR